MPIFAAIAVWAPLRHNYFFGDDFIHLYDIATLSFRDLATQVWGGHVYFVRNVVFVAMFELFGTDPRPYFWSVLLTHALNALLLHRVIQQFTQNVYIACFGATLWAACPILEGALGWYSVYGQVLLTSIVLGVLSTLGHSLRRGASISVRTALAWTVLLALGSTCFGMGVGIAAVFPIVVALALPPGRVPRVSMAVLVVGALVTTVAYILIITYGSGMSPEVRDLFLVSSMLRALPALLNLQAHLVAFGTAALLFDVGWQERLPLWTQAAGATCLLLLLLAGTPRAAGPSRRLLLALSLLVAGAYGAIAAGRAKFYTLLSVELAVAATAPRYHYLPAALLTVLVSVALGALMAAGRVTGRVVYAGLGLWMIARTIAFVAHPLSLNHWDDQRAETESMLKSVREQVASTLPGTVVHIKNLPFGLSRALPDVMPGWAGMFVVFSPSNTVDGRPVRFVVSDEDYERAQARGGRIAALVEHP